MTLRPRKLRRGVASMLAMLFLILFSVLAMGFYSMVSTAQQAAGGEQRVAKAFSAAETGMEVMRYQMSKLSVPGGTADTALIDQAYPDLQTLFNGTANMNGNVVGLSSGVISIPSGSTQYITIDSNSKFRATIRRNTTSPTNELIVHTIGVYGTKNATRAIEMRFKPAVAASTWFNYSMASAGGIVMSKGTVTDTTSLQAGFLSTYTGSPALNLTGGSLEGEIAVTGSTSQITLGGSSISGSTNSTTILNDHTNIVPATSLPTFDTSGFAALATNTWTSSMNSPFINCRVPAGSNPQFKTGDEVRGILYIESPNVVIFKGDCTIRGMIVFQNSGNNTQNSMEFKGGASMLGLPSDAAYDSLRSITGVGILAPTAAMTMKGSSDTDIIGNIIVSTFADQGNADISITNGTLMATSNTAGAINLAGKTVTFSGNGQYNPPSMGVAGDQKFLPQPRTYLEVAP